MLGGRVVGPRDVRIVEPAAERRDVETRALLAPVSALLQHPHQRRRSGIAPPGLHQTLALPADEGFDRHQRVVACPGGLSRDREQVIGERRAHGRGEEVVGEREFLGPMPVVGRIGRTGGRIGLLTCEIVDGKAVHLPVVVAGDRRVVVVLHILGKDLLQAPAEVDGLAVHLPGRRTVGAGEQAEEVVEAAVLLDDEDHVLDRELRVECGCIDLRGTPARWVDRDVDPAQEPDGTRIIGEDPSGRVGRPGVLAAGAGGCKERRCGYESEELADLGTSWKGLSV